jgi:hypothetical protein
MGSLSSSILARISSLLPKNHRTLYASLFKKMKPCDNTEEEKLKHSIIDYVATATKSILGCAPFVGSLLAELAGSIIPNQRVDRIAKFASALEAKISKLDQAFVRSQLTNEHFTDLLEDAIPQAARSLSDERREHLASLIDKSLSCEAANYDEFKHMLKILGELSDSEIIWLRSYHFHPFDAHKEFIDRHKEILKPVFASLGAPEAVLQKSAIQKGYKAHLTQLGLLNPIYEPVGFEDDGRRRVKNYEITLLGSQLLRQLDLVPARPAQAAQPADAK